MWRCNETRGKAHRGAAGSWPDFVLLAAVFAYLLVLSAILPVNFDEAYNLQVPLMVAREGRYESIYHFRSFDALTTLTLGPTVQLPIALAFKVFDAGLLPARLARFPYVAGLIAMIWIACARSYGRMIALAVLLIWFAMPDQLQFSLWVLGEVPAICFVWLGMLWWARDPTRNQKVAIFLIGLSVVTKLSFALILPPLLIYVAIRGLHRRSAILGLAKEILLAGVLFVLPLAIWEVAKWLYLGPAQYGNYLAEYVDFLAWYQRTRDSIGIVDRSRILSDHVFPAMHPSITLALFAGIAVTGIAGLSRPQRDEQIPASLSVLIFITAWTHFVFFAPMAWWRYLFAFSTLFLYLLGGLAHRFLSLLPGPRQRAVGSALLWIPLVVFVLPGAIHQHEATRAFPEQLTEQREFASAVGSYVDRGYRIGVHGWWQAPEISFLAGGIRFVPFACGRGPQPDMVVILTKLEQTVMPSAARALEACLGQELSESADGNYGLYAPL